MCLLRSCYTRSISTTTSEYLPKEPNPGPLLPANTEVAHSMQMWWMHPTWRLCDISVRNESWIQISLKSCLPTTYFYPIILKLYTEHGSINAVLCAKFRKDISNKTGLMDERDTVRFVFNMSFRGMSYIAYPQDASNIQYCLVFHIDPSRQ